MRRFAAIQPRAADLPAAVREVTRFSHTPGAPNTRTLSRSTEGPLHIEHLHYEAEPGRHVPATLYQPSQPRGAILVADSSGKSAPSARALASAGFTVLAIDSALTGDTAHRAASYSASWFPQDKAIWLTLMIGRTVTGLRMTDLSKALDLLAARSLLPPSGASLFARGNPGVAALHLAVLDPRIARLALEDMPPSFRTLATTPIHRQIFDVVLPGVLHHYDIAQLTAHLAPRPVIFGYSATAATPHQPHIRRRESASIPDTYLPHLTGKE
jgi:hypothetical protein